MTAAPGYAMGADRDTDRGRSDHDLVALSRRFEGMAKQLEGLVEKAEHSTAQGRGDAASDRLADAIARMDQRIDHLAEENRAAAGQIERRVGAVDRALAQLGHNRLLGTFSGGPLDPSLDRAVAEIAARQRTLEGVALPASAEVQALVGPDWSGLEEQLRGVARMLQTMQSPCRAQEMIEVLRGELAEIGRTVREALPRHAFEALEREVRSLGARLDASRQAGADGSAVASLEKGLAEVRDALIGLAPVGLDDAVTTLSEKMDAIAASGGDPAALQQLETTIAGLRSVVARVASGDALAALAKEVRALAERIETRIAAAPLDSFANLEKEFANIADMLKQQQAGPAADVAPLLAAITQQLDRLQMPGDGSALASLEARMARLVEKLDASEARLGHLASIERGMTELIAHLGELKARRETAAEPSSGASDDRPGGQPRNREIPSAGPAPTERAPVPEIKLRAEAARPAPQPAASSKAAPAAQAAGPTPLAPDTPLEPGSGPPRRGGGRNAADRVAAAQAALGGAGAPAEAEAKPNFIVAARRAAQAANEQQAYQRPSRIPSEAAPGTVGKKLAERVKSLFVTTNLILVAVVALPVAAKYSGLIEFGGAPDQVASAPPTIEAPAQATAQAAAPTESTTASVAPPQRSGLVMGNDPALAFASAGMVGRSLDSDITGAVAPPSPAPAKPSAPAAKPAAAAPSPAVWSDPPAGIGGKALLAGLAAGDAAAAYEVGARLVEGRGVAANLETAALWFSRAADRGMPLAQFRLGNMYEKGLGVKKDLQEARRFYVAAAEKGNANAMHNIAVLYAEGIDGKPDYAAAAQWFLKAARYGIKDSQYNLAILYARGIGVEQNLAEAFKWFGVAALHNDQDAARKRDDVAGKLDQAALAAARLAVQGFVADRQPVEAISTQAPAGGWDDAAATAAPAKAKPRSRLEQSARL